MSQTATIKSLPRAFRMLKAMEAAEVEWGEDYRQAGAEALTEVMESQMAGRIDRHLEEMAARDAADRRNGSYRRWLMTELGEIELSVPRTRTFSALSVVRAYARRAAHIDRMILACFVLGLSTRKVATALLPVLGRRISAATVSEVAKILDTAVAAFHRRPVADIYPVLMLDGVVLSRKTGAGALRRPVLVALGLRADGRKEIIDWRLATAESAVQWEQFLTDLFRRGLIGKTLKMICVDGGQGLLAALPMVYPGIAIQRCWAHKIRNILGKVSLQRTPAVEQTRMQALYQGRYLGSMRPMSGGRSKTFSACRRTGRSGATTVSPGKGRRCRSPQAHRHHYVRATVRVHEIPTERSRSSKGRAVWYGSIRKLGRLTGAALAS